MLFLFMESIRNLYHIQGAHKHIEKFIKIIEDNLQKIPSSLDLI